MLASTSVMEFNADRDGTWRAEGASGSKGQLAKTASCLESLLARPAVCSVLFT